MDENLHDTELLLRYLDNKLDAAEINQLEDRLRSDEVLREELERLQLSIEAVKYYGLREQVAQIHKEEFSRNHQSRGKVVNIRRHYKRLMAIAAVFLVLLAAAAVIYVSNVSGSEVYSDAFVEYTVAATRSTSETPQIEQAFQNGNYSHVVGLEKSSRLTDEEQLLVGLSYLKLNQDSMAIQQLLPLSRSKGSYAQDAEFYLALAYIKTKNYAAALPLMYAIHSNKKHLYHDNISMKQIYDVKLLKWKKGKN